MKAKIFFIPVFSMLFSFAVFSQQSKSSTLMTIGNDKVTIDDLMNVYRKNNNKEGVALDKKSMEEYLDLYSVFRLKVKEAKEMGIDTTKAFKDELSGYRKTLAQPYLTDKDAIDNLVKEAYERMKWDIRTSHILKNGREPCCRRHNGSVHKDHLYTRFYQWKSKSCYTEEIRSHGKS